MYFSGQGKLKIALIVVGVLAAGYRWVGNVPDFKPAFATSKNEHKESYTGQRLPDKTLTTEEVSGLRDRAVAAAATAVGAIQR